MTKETRKWLLRQGAITGALADSQLSVSTNPGEQQEPECLPEITGPAWGEHTQGSTQPRV